MFGLPEAEASIDEMARAVRWLVAAPAAAPAPAGGSSAE